MSQAPRASFLFVLQSMRTVLLCLFLSPGIQAKAQEIEARAYSNAPISSIPGEADCKHIAS
jgi:hypothetical protein